MIVMIWIARRHQLCRLCRVDICCIFEPYVLLRQPQSFEHIMHLSTDGTSAVDSIGTPQALAWLPKAVVVVVYAIASYVT